jgi:hypothetical protein
MRDALRRARAPRLPRLAWAVLAAAGLAGAAIAYQLARKPTELLGLVVPAAPKTPEGTWAEYGGSFERHATASVPPELLAALAQVESAGDPLARTYWRWRWSWNPLELYGPASSAVGLLQMTDGNYELARRLCIHDGAVVEAGRWSDLDACWFNGLYLRTVPGHAIEMTAAWLHRSVDEILAAERIRRPTSARKQRLAAVVHLCGRERAAAFARRGFWVLPGERCGDHDLARYLARVKALSETFERARRTAR